MCQIYSWNLCFLCLMILRLTLGYPTGKADMENQVELRDEKHYPNGSIIGKYSYMDREGNPIQVKYYADEGSYGVELKSFKVESSGDPSASTFQAVKFDDLLRTTEPPYRFPQELLNSNFPAVGNKYKTGNPYDFLNRETAKTNRYKIEKGNPDYDIFYQNEVNSPKKCNNEKVRIYTDKEKRKIRNAVDNFDADKYCEQF